MTPVEVTRGAGPVVLGMPHTGTYVPGDIWDRLNDRGRALTDTDWHIHQLYDGLLDDVTVVRATFHRYVVDANRDPQGHSLYPGRNTTGLVPMTDFDGRAIWRTPPDDAEIAARRDAWHAPYHAALEAELARLRDTHGVAVLYDCHSIRSEIPYLFEGTLADFNIGTNDGATCAREIAATAEDVCTAATDYTTTVNGRFKGGWTTRHYGRPTAGLHAIQMELAQATYMRECPPWTYLPARAEAVRAPLGCLLGRLDALARAGQGLSSPALGRHDRGQPS
ncbi:N-formylglutamate deformylase [Rhodovibrio salinarum]|uniref:N-formylglutamate deformylase n=1 Tax=Rhodovibrio salinarum TaxID=1087 RepID=UPI0004BCFABE|nr:N-formylglutamate deformylase [Rhodovibrio salinarum]